ncbi:MAG TPA: hypothetical protein VJ692_16055 [Nitrospiraceae bacterium]|nr:hypothetical protein [Nitrospiraceae bacterium]
MEEHAGNTNDVEKELDTLGLTPPFTRADLDEKRRELLAMWHPHRYANLTNNPRKYMQMYKKGEAMTKAIQESYSRLVTWLEGSNAPQNKDQDTP